MLRNLANAAVHRRSYRYLHYRYFHHHPIAWQVAVPVLPFGAAPSTTSALTLTVTLTHSSHFHYHPRRFLSRQNNYGKVDAAIITEFCHSVGLTDLKQSNTHIIVKECPFCTKPTNNQLDNQYKLYLKSDDGAYKCHRCDASGSWYNFKANLNGDVSADNDLSFKSPASPSSATKTAARGTGGGGDGGQNASVGGVSGHGTFGGGDDGGDDSEEVYNTTTSTPATPVSPSLIPDPRESGFYSSMLLDANNKKDDGDNELKTNSSLEYLMNVRGFTRVTLRKYGVGRNHFKFRTDEGWVKAECITFPWMVKASAIRQQEKLRGVEYQMPIRDLPPAGSIGSSESTTTATITPTNTNDSSSTVNNDNTQPAAHSDKIQDATAAATDNTATFAPVATTVVVGAVGANDGDDVVLAAVDGVDVSNSTTEYDPFIICRIKARAVNEKAWQRMYPTGGLVYGLFGLHTVPDGAKEIVLTEGEYDAMAVSQATGRPAVSLPNGCNSLPDQVLPLLESFEKIYLWMDNDEPGKKAVPIIAKKLGLKRCFIVDCIDAKDANEALLKGLQLEQYLKKAQLLKHERIRTFGDLRDEVFKEIMEPDLYKGAAILSLPLFTKIIKGFRLGEMTVLTGPTGSGKTTFLGQVSLDLAEQGINVLWGSFEIKNTRLIQKLLKQFSREALPDPKESNTEDVLNILNELGDRFDTLPLRYLDFHGGSDIDEVLEAMEYSVNVNGTQHIILDNMQFMISRSAMSKKGGSFEKFDVQDMAIEKFRQFATFHNVHLVLVVHPRKEDESAALNLSSFYGSAKATQEADTVLILQTDGRRKYLEVKKNRFDGTLGITPLFFESKSGRYVETEGGSIAPEGS